MSSLADRAGHRRAPQAAPARPAAESGQPVPAHGAQGTILGLQRNVGNHATSALIQRLRVEAGRALAVPDATPASAGGISRALRYGGRALDDQTRSAFESAFARTGVAPISAAVTERHPASGRLLASPRVRPNARRTACRGRS